VHEKLPSDLTQADPQTLQQARDECDDRLTALFRRWPRLRRQEMRELRAVHDERVRIAKYIGSLRRRGRKNPLTSQARQ
jgi:hypothetical protein